MSIPPKSNDDALPSDTPEGEAKPRARRTSTRSSTAASGVKRVRTRKPKAADSNEESAPSVAQQTGDLFSMASESSENARLNPAAEQPAREERAAAPAAQEEPRSERRDREAPATVEPARAEQAAPSREAAPAFEPRPEPSQREVFVPEGRDQSVSTPSESVVSDTAPQATQEASAASGEAGEGGQDQRQQGDNRPVIKDRNYWKQLKKDKKKWKQEQRSQGGGHHQGGHQGGGHQGGGHAGHKHTHEKEKHPQQPPPPKFESASGDLPPPSRFDDVLALDAQSADIVANAQGEIVWLDELYDGTLSELNAFARLLGVPMEGAPPSRRVLLGRILDAAFAAKRCIRDRGWLDLTDSGHGFIVHSRVNYRLYPENTYVPASLVNRFGLKRGHQLEVVVSPAQGNERCCSAIRIESVMGKDPGELAKVVPFEELTPYYPLKRILVEANEVHVKDVSMRAVDILTPIGFGQRGLIVAPPRTGKTVLMHNIANSISENYPDIKLLILLVDERPEEVTDFKRHTKGEVVASTFDEMPENHVHAAEMVSEKAKRLVEQGEHVIILLDSITRLARAYNALASNSGKIMSGGIEATALQKPKRFFGAARNIEGAGSLTILGTALIDTGSRMDEVIFEEFKGTGNMELHLDRGLSDKRIFPAVNIDRSGTRKEELIYHPEELQRIYGLRRAMQGLGPIESMDMLIQRLKKTKTNAEFLIGLSRT